MPELEPGDVIVMDTLSNHERASVSTLIEAAGARLLVLPPYGPDSSPIGKVFSRLKAMLRMAGERSVSGLWSLIGKLVGLFQSQDRADYISSCIYDPD